MTETPQLADWAAFWIGEMAQEQGELSLIRRVFSGRSPPWGRFWLAAWLFSEASYDSAVVVLSPLSQDESGQTILRLISGYFLGLSFSRLGNSESAMAEFERLTNEFPRSVLNGEIRYRLASIAFAQDNWEKSREHLGAAIDFYDLSSRKWAHWWIDEAHFLLGAIDFMEGRHIIALRRFQRLENSYPESPYIERLPYLAVLGQIETRATDAATDSFLLEALSPDLLADVHMRIAYLFMEDGEFVIAQDKFINAAEIAEDKSLKGECFLFAGECAYRRRKFSEAVDYYNMTQTLAPSRKREASWGLGWSFLRLRKYEDSRLYLASVFSGFDDGFSQSARLTYAETFLMEGRPRRAIAELNDFIAVADESLLDRVLYDLIIAFKAVGDTHRVVETSERFLERFRRSPLAEEIVPNYAEILFEQKEYTKLINLADQIELFAVGREKADKVRFLGEKARYHIGIYADMLQMMDKFLEKFPDSPLVGEVMLDIGSYLCNIEDFEKGAMAFQKLRERRRSIPDTLWIEASHRMGLCFLAMNDTSAARRVMLGVLDEFKSMPDEGALAAEGVIDYGDYMLSIGHVEPALQAFNRILEDIENPEITALAEIRLAICYELVGRFEEARLILQSIWESAGYSLSISREAFLGLLRVYYSMAEYESGFDMSKAVFDTLEPGDFKCSLGQELGRFALRLGWTEIAFDKLLPPQEGSYLCAKNTNPSILHDLALALEARNRLSDAKIVWEWIIQTSENDSIVAMARDKLKKFGSSPNQ